MIFVPRGRRSGGRFLVPKLALFFTGAAVFLAGVLLQRDDVVPFAIPILLAGIALRFFEREPEDDQSADADGLSPPE